MIIFEYLSNLLISTIQLILIIQSMDLVFEGLYFSAKTFLVLVAPQLFNIVKATQQLQARIKRNNQIIRDMGSEIQGTESSIKNLRQQLKQNDYYQDQIRKNISKLQGQLMAQEKKQQSKRKQLKKQFQLKTPKIITQLLKSYQYKIMFYQLLSIGRTNYDYKKELQDLKQKHTKELSKFDNEYQLYKQYESQLDQQLQKTHKKSNQLRSNIKSNQQTLVRLKTQYQKATKSIAQKQKIIQPYTKPRLKLILSNEKNIVLLTQLQQKKREVLSKAHQIPDQNGEIIQKNVQCKLCP